MHRGMKVHGISLLVPPTSTSFLMLTEGKEEQEDWIAALNEAQGLSVTNTERFSEERGIVGSYGVDCGVCECLWVPLWGG